MQQVWIQARNSPLVLPADLAHRWLLNVARNLLAANARQAAAREQTLSREARSLVARMSTRKLPREALESNELRQALWLAITELPHEHQAVLIQHYCRGASLSDIAQSSGLSERAVEGRLYRARQQLRSILDSLARGGS